ncbi:biotin transport system permease protein [Desulfosporosinus lacus DSM 15449]|uniref:Biotin transport system permease protein n=2 Tax=Desulfosporosinus TaxID=79206 RepID=A0A1M5XMG0_9FIRM|nr:energy-coupling factor transporter transmembrane component T [Desulfosporosinus lacus]SHI01027.1 biotin transport system permease protein [Desulfosporosinus lacus DSM 15449]
MYRLGQYVYLESPVHRLDPRVKLIAVIALSIIILHVNLMGLTTASAIALAISLLARLSLGSVLKTLRPVLPFFCCLFLLYIFFTPGRPLPPFPIGPMQITYEGLNLGILQVWKFLLLVAAASILTMTATQSEITMGLERLLRPIRVAGISSHDVAMLLSLALRFMPALLDEMNCVSQAQLARGANFNPRHLSGKIRAIRYLAVPLAINIFRRCDELVDAMEARGYQQGHRTYLRELVLSRSDYCLIGAIIILSIAVVAG